MYKTEKPVNSAAISPLKDHVLLGGGQEAVDAALYSKSGKFEARFFHLVFEEEFGRVRDHFGPINNVAFHPDGKRFVKLENFDLDFFFFKLNFCVLATAVVVRTVLSESTILINPISTMKSNTTKSFYMTKRKRNK